ncbi:uncharacterized glycosyl hydrolase [[Candida] jaroonii]|uniref:Uncharacterized glycosyl hydrolase n=1 Tax=[Candida] jaroonii TaxID=467808 RepID=A0ACA9Y725_9ASCO|nr:uncharacterized glycosyl hydrolase [[Candida] jaroonii]
MVFGGLKVKSKANNIPTVQLPGDKPSKRQIYQYRQNYGVNLGACFVLEKWIFHDLFIDNTNFELEAAEKSMSKLGKDEAQKKFEDHWNGFMTDDDWKWLEDHNVTSLRIPVGYWEVDGGKFTDGTKFSKVKDIYKNAWTIFKSQFVEKAGNHGISVVVDIHGLPGGANGDSHSGEKEGGDAEFWSSSSAQLSMCDMLRFIAKDLKSYDNIGGIQVVNESVFADDPKKQRYYYGAAINSIREEDKEVPVIISDGWWPDQWVKWVQEKQDNGNIGVVVDHHCYRCASDNDKKKSPPQIIQDLEGDLLTNLNDGGKGVDFMIGEYSCVMDGQSWDKDNANAKRDDLVVDFGRKQTELMNQRAGFGWFFWTFKFQSGNGGEWDFKTMSDKGAISCPIAFRGKSIPDDGKRDKRGEEEFNGHKNYWDNANPKEKYEHDRFKDGFLTAWNDSKTFAEFNGSVIGRKEAWKGGRLAEHIKAKGKGKHVWEWEHGFDAGLKAFKDSW